MARRILTHAALALALSAGLTATSDAARADERSGGHDRYRTEDRQHRDGHRDNRRDHAGDRSTHDQDRGGRSYDRNGGRWNDQSRQRDGRDWQQSRHDNERSRGSWDSRRDSGRYQQPRYGYNHGYQQPRYGYDSRYQQPRYGYGYTPGYSSRPGYRYSPSYRYSYGGRYYNTDDYGARLLRNSINFGYQQGIEAAYVARQSNWGYDYYRDCDAYRSGLYGYEGGYIDQGQYSYYFRLGFERGYREAFYGNGGNAGYYAGGYRAGPVDLVVGVLDVILNLQHLDHHRR